MPRPVKSTPKSMPKADPVSTEDTRKADIPETVVDSKTTDDNLRTTGDNILVEGTFASKDTPRVTTVMADGIAYVREIADDFIRDTNLADDVPIMNLAVKLSEWAESRLRAFSGTEKKQMVLRLLLWVIENQEDVLCNVLGENEDELYKFVRDVVPSFLDVVCAAAKGKIMVNKIVKVSNICLGWCFGNKKV